MAKKNQTYDDLVEDMKLAGTYEPFMRLQILDAADTYDTINRYQKIINKEPVKEEYKTGGADIKLSAHPLITAVAQLKNVLAKQLGYLGLNYSSQKKAESSIKPKQDEHDPTAEYFSSING